MQPIKLHSLSLMSIIILISSHAHAYVGPGAGITMLGALWAVILAVVLAIGGILLWPLRNLLKKIKNNKEVDTNM